MLLHEYFRSELYTVAVEWNHIISKSINGGRNGRQETMFLLPHLYNSNSFLENIDLQELGAGERIDPHVTDTTREFSDDFHEFAELVLHGSNREDMPSDVISGFDLFSYLKERITDFS